MRLLVDNNNFEFDCSDQNLLSNLKPKIGNVHFLVVELFMLPKIDTSTSYDLY